MHTKKRGIHPEKGIWYKYSVALVRLYSFSGLETLNGDPVEPQKACDFGDNLRTLETLDKDIGSGLLGALTKLNPSNKTWLTSDHPNLFVRDFGDRMLVVSRIPVLGVFAAYPGVMGTAKSFPSMKEANFSRHPDNPLNHWVVNQWRRWIINWETISLTKSHFSASPLARAVVACHPVCVIDGN